VLHARRSGAVAAGDAVEAFVRPEVARLAREPGALPAGQPQHRATVESLLFDGANSAVLLREATSALEFRIALPQTGEFSDLRVGEAVSFGFDPQRAVCFAATGHGR
jgi:spermidine/putrescine transport system ATP-binding protein